MLPSCSADGQVEGIHCSASGKNHFILPGNTNECHLSLQARFFDFSYHHFSNRREKHLYVARIEPRSILGFTDQSYLDLVSSECLSGHLKQCREGCDQNLPQFVGSISSGNGNSGFYVGDEATFVCLAGFGLNPAMKNSAKSTVKWLGG